MFTKHHFSVSVCSPSLRPQLTSWARCAVRSRKPLSRWCDSSCTMAKSCLSSVPLPTQRSTAHSEFKHTSSALKRLYLTFLTCLPFLQGSQHHIPGKLTDVQMHWWDHEAGRDALPAGHTQTHHWWSESECLLHYNWVSSWALRSLLFACRSALTTNLVRSTPSSWRSLRT